MPPTNRAFMPVVALQSNRSLRTAGGRTNFYREELVKHWRCLDEQREYYSVKAITDVEAVLQRLMREMDTLCARENGDQLVSHLLRKIDGVTRLSSWSDPKKSH